jgi:hypothetical protein
MIRRRTLPRPLVAAVAALPVLERGAEEGNRRALPEALAQSGGGPNAGGGGRPKSERGDGVAAEDRRASMHRGKAAGPEPPPRG